MYNSSLSNEELLQIEKLSQQDVPKLKQGPDTFLSIAGFPHYEDVISNIYAHFLDYNKYELLAAIMLDSIKEIYETKRTNIIANTIDNSSKDQMPNPWPKDLTAYFVVREQTLTISDERIDIVLASKSQKHNEPSSCVIIENKIYHTLENNLHNYWKNYKTDQKAGVLLVLKEIKNYQSHKNYHSSFIQITHSELLNKVDERIDKSSIDIPQLQYIKDLVMEINKLSNMPDHSNLIEIYTKHHLGIENGIQLKESIRKNFLKSVEEFYDLEKDLEIFKRKDYLNSQDYRTIVISNNPEIHLTFFFRHYEGKSNIFKIALEHSEPNEELIIAFKTKNINNPIFNLVKNNHLAKDTHWNGWLRPREIHYNSTDIIDNNFTTTLRDVFNRDWQKFCKDYLALIE